MVRISQLAAAALLPPGIATAEVAPAAAENSDLELAAGVAYDILPYDELPPDLYVKAARQILDLQNAEVVAGLRRVRDSIHESAWRDVPEGQRAAILTSLQGTVFFRALRTNTLQVLLREPAVFAIVGYGGPSIPHGGYLVRGFDDIDWLPAATNE